VKTDSDLRSCWTRGLLEDFQADPKEVIGDGPLLYSDFMMPNTGNKIYELITDHEKMSRIMEEYLDDYNQVNTAQMKLVLFLDAIRHVCRISRIIRQPLGNALLLGVGGSGRQSQQSHCTHVSVSWN